MRRIRVKKKKLKVKYLLIFLGIIVIVAIILGGLYLLKNRKKTDLVYANFEMVVSKLDEGTYYLFGVKKDISFEITKNDDFSFEVVDSDNNKVECTTIESDKEITIKAPDDLYEDGENYTLKINNGSFKDEKLKDGKEVIFNVKRAASESSILKESVKSINKEDINIDNDVLKYSEKLEKDDIIAILQNEDITAVYKVINGNSEDGYKIELPKLNEVYKEYDYYGMEKVNLEQFKTDEKSSKILLAMIKRTIVDSLVDTVYADSTVKIVGPTWNKKTNELDYIVKINTNEKEKVFESEFLSEHKANITFEVTISANLYRNISFDNYDVALIVNMKVNPKMELISIDSDFNEYNKAFDTNDDKYDTTKIKENNTANIEKMEYEKNIGEGIIKTNIPGLYVKLNAITMLNVNGKTNLAANMDESIKYTAGINNDIGIYGDISYEAEGKMTAFGDVNSKIGTKSSLEVLFFNLNTMKAEIISGLDITNKVEKKDGKTEEKEEMVSVTSSGIIKTYNTFNIESNTYEEAKKKTLADSSKEINKSKKEYDFVIKKEEEKKEEEADDKLSAEVVKNKLKESFDNKKSSLSESMNTITVKYQTNISIDVDNNILSKTYNYDDGKMTYTCNYNYLKETMECSNHAEAVSYVKGICDKLYADYLEYEETGETENEDAEEWEFLYGSLDKCYYEVVDKNEPSDYKEEFEIIMNEAKLTAEDLKLLQ